MTIRQKKAFNWTMASLITVAGLIWAASAWAGELNYSDAEQDCRLDQQQTKDEILESQVIEIRTRMEIAEARLDINEERMNREMSRISSQIDQIYQWMMEDRQ